MTASACSFAVAVLDCKSSKAIKSVAAILRLTRDCHYVTRYDVTRGGDISGVAERKDGEPDHYSGPFDVSLSAWSSQPRHNRCALTPWNVLLRNNCVA